MLEQGITFNAEGGISGGADTTDYSGMTKEDAQQLKDKKRKARAMKRKNHGSLFYSNTKVDMASQTTMSGPVEASEVLAATSGKLDFKTSIFGDYDYNKMKDKCTQMGPLMVTSDTQTLDVDDTNTEGMSEEQKAASEALRKVKDELRAKVDKHQYRVNRKRDAAKRHIRDAITESRDTYYQISTEPALSNETQRLDLFCCSLEVEIAETAPSRLDTT